MQDNASEIHGYRSRKHQDPTHEARISCQSLGCTILRFWPGQNPHPLVLPHRGGGKDADGARKRLENHSCLLRTKLGSCSVGTAALCITFQLTIIIVLMPLRPPCTLSSSLHSPQKTRIVGFLSANDYLGNGRRALPYYFISQVLILLALVFTTPTPRVYLGS